MTGRISLLVPDPANPVHALNEARCPQSPEVPAEGTAKKRRTTFSQFLSQRTRDAGENQRTPHKTTYYHRPCFWSLLTPARQMKPATRSSAAAMTGYGRPQSTEVTQKTHAGLKPRGATGYGRLQSTESTAKQSSAPKQNMGRCRSQCDGLPAPAAECVGGQHPPEPRQTGLH